MFIFHQLLSRIHYAQYTLVYAASYIFGFNGKLPKQVVNRVPLAVDPRQADNGKRMDGDLNK